MLRNHFAQGPLRSPSQCDRNRPRKLNYSHAAPRRVGLECSVSGAAGSPPVSPPPRAQACTRSHCVPHTYWPSPHGSGGATSWPQPRSRLMHGPSGGGRPRMPTHARARAGPPAPLRPHNNPTTTDRIERHTELMLRVILTRAPPPASNNALRASPGPERGFNIESLEHILSEGSGSS